MSGINNTGNFFVGSNTVVKNHSENNNSEGSSRQSSRHDKKRKRKTKSLDKKEEVRVKKRRMEEEETAEEELESTLTAEGIQEFMQKFQNLFLDRKEKRFVLNGKHKGYVLIINNLFNKEGQGPRYSSLLRVGADKDQEKMIELFVEKLNFVPRVRNNVSVEDLDPILIDFRKTCSLKESECHSCFVILMSHGGSQLNTIVMDGETLPEVNVYEDIINKHFTSPIPPKGLRLDKSEGRFKEIPKVFIIQACRRPGLPSRPGDERPKLKKKRVELLDESDESDDVPLVIEGVTNLEDRQLDNAYICHSTRSYKVAYRKPSSGSLFISAIYDVFRKKAATVSLREMMLEVYTQVVEKSGKRQEPCVEDSGFKTYTFIKVQ